MASDSLDRKKSGMIGVVVMGGSVSSLASFVAWPLAHSSGSIEVWALGAAGAAAYSGLTFYVERLAFRLKKDKTAASAIWDTAAAILIPPVGLLAFVQTFL